MLGHGEARDVDRLDLTTDNTDRTDGRAAGV
jgi:hypothetical protein